MIMSPQHGEGKSTVSVNGTPDIIPHSALSQQPWNGRHSPRILVLDDDESVRALEARLLTVAHYTVETANNSNAAWQLLQQKNYDLLLTDYIMPGTSGLALVRQLRIAKMTLPVVMVSGSVAELDTESLSRNPWSNICAFVRKPFTADELLSSVHGALTQTAAPAARPTFSPDRQA